MYYGIDVHKDKCIVYGIGMSETQPRCEEFNTCHEDIDKFIRTLNREEDQVAVESSTVGTFVYKKMRNAGIKAYLANTRKIPRLENAKTDKIDARTLARLLRMGELPISYVPDDELLEIREIVRRRIQLGRELTKVKNRIQSLLARHGIIYTGRDIFTQAGLKWLKNISLQEYSQKVLESELEVYRTLAIEIERIMVQMAKIAHDRKEIKLLMTIPGIDYYSALVIISEIGDIRRFDSKKKFSSYCGVVPHVNYSGNTKHPGNLSRACNHNLKWIISLCAEANVKLKGELRNRYINVKSKKCGEKAIINIAHKLACIIWGVLTTMTPYRKSKSRLTVSKLKKMERHAEKADLKEQSITSLITDIRKQISKNRRTIFNEMEA